MKRPGFTRHLADSLTISRTVAALLMLAWPAYGIPFWVLYIWGGLSDMLDGPVARWTGSASQRGAFWDSLSDLAFLIACLIKLLPVIHLPVWIWIWTGAIAVLKMLHMAYGWIRHHRLMMPHTLWNRITGLFLFLLPILSLWIPMTIPAIVTCAVATIAAMQEYT